MEIYFDNAATTKTSKVALDKMIYMSQTNYANPSSVHKLGLLAEKEIENARKILANVINCRQDEIFFTSGATESNNLAIIGIANAYKRDGNHIITQRTEHASVVETVKFLEEQGFNISYLENDKNGNIDLNNLKNLITDETILVSLMHVNNETGAILDIKSIGKIIKEQNKNTLFHTDCVQSFSKFDIDVKQYCIDLLSFSGHKLHAPKGVGGLYIKKGTKIKAIHFGGNQQNKIRSGTENIIGITALAESVLETYKEKEVTYKHVMELKNELITIKDELDDVYVNGQNSSPYVVSISFVGVKGEVLVHALEEKDIFCSTGSACHKGVGSSVLKEYGYEENIYNSGIRISFCALNTVQEVLELKKALIEIVPMLRRFKKR